MTKKRLIVAAQADAKGNITAVRFRGNQNFTNVATAIKMAKRDEIDNAHAVKRAGAKEFLRTNPDNSSANNLDTMAGDD